jgi:hypothetical protein
MWDDLWHESRRHFFVTEHCVTGRAGRQPSGRPCLSVRLPSPILGAAICRSATIDSWDIRLG